MPSLKDRELVTMHICATCKHCMVSLTENDDGYAYSDLWNKVHHCMLGVSKADRKFVKKEIDDYDGHAYEASFTDKFNQIMEMNSEYRDQQYLDESARFVRYNQCCQFYEGE